MPATCRSELRARIDPRGVRGFVALGDSFTAGSDGSSAGERWPDLLAARLRESSSVLSYSNLAVAGARSEEVARGQLPGALHLDPDVVTLVCGANDVLLSVRPDVERAAAMLGWMLGRLRAGLPRAAILTATMPNPAARMRLHARSRRRIEDGMERLACATRLVARRHGVVCLEFAAHPGAGEGGNFADDGYHPSNAGHRQVAEAFSAALGGHFGIEATSSRHQEAL